MRETQLDSPYPEPAGGAIVDGVYEMIRFEVYAPARADEHVRRRRLYVSGNQMVSVNHDDDDPVQAVGGSFRVEGTSFVATIDCPAGVDAQIAPPFTAADDEFWIFDPSEPNVQVYTRIQP